MRTDEIKGCLASATTREEAEACIKDAGLTVSALRQLLGDLGIEFRSSDRKKDLIWRAVERTVGSRLKSQAFRDVRLTTCSGSRRSF